MRYYKIIENGQVVDAGELFLKWQPKNRILIACDPKEAQFITSISGLEIYRVPWLNPPPKEAGQFRTVEAALIDRQEFLDIRAMLDDGEKIVCEEPVTAEPPEETESVPDEPESQKVETLAQLRSRVSALEALVHHLADQVSGATEE